MSTTTKTAITVPVHAELTWVAPGSHFFLHQPEQITADVIRASVESALRERPSLEAFADEFNLVGSVEISVDGQRITDHLVTDEDVSSEEGEQSFALRVTIEGRMQPNNGPGAMRSWSYPEIYDELAQYSDLGGDAYRFRVEVRPV